MSKFQKLVDEKKKKWAKILREALKKQSRQGKLSQREKESREKKTRQQR